MITPKQIGIAAAIVVLVGLISYFRYVGMLPSLLTPEQRETITAQEEKIADLEAQNKKAREEIMTAKASQALAEHKEKEASGRLAQRNQEIAAWAAKYAELKSKPMQLVTKTDEAREALRQMGWSQ